MNNRDALPETNTLQCTKACFSEAATIDPMAAERTLPSLLVCDCLQSVADLTAMLDPHALVECLKGLGCIASVADSTPLY